MAAWADLPINERGIASAFYNRFNGGWHDRQEYRFDKQRGRWMAFDGEGYYSGHWRPATAILDAVGKLIEVLCDGKPSAVSKWGTLRVYRAVLTLATESMTVDCWDTDDALMGLLGLPNGEVWDLEAGYSQPNFRRLPITKTTGADPGEFHPGPACKGAACECAWHRFIDDTTGGDRDMAEHLQLSVGASLFGGNRDHRLNVVAGDGGTGKSVFVGTIAKALGQYAGAMPSTVLAARGSDQHPTGLAGVVDKRFVVVPEVSGGQWKEEVLKPLTGGDALPVRFMRQDFFEVKPECTLWVTTNAPPSLKMVDDAIRRRLRIWPFEHKPKEVDPRLSEKLQTPAMLGRVLQWALEGGYVNRCVNDIRRRLSQPLIQWRFHPHTVHRDRRLRSTQGPSDA